MSYIIPEWTNLKRLGTCFLKRENTLETDSAVAGDIVAASKLQFAQTGDTLCEKANIIKYPGVFFPEPSLYMAVQPKEKGDDEKISQDLASLWKRTHRLYWKETQRHIKHSLVHREKYKLASS